MKTFIFIQAAISHNLKDPHSKALEPDGLSPLLPLATQSLDGEGGGAITVLESRTSPVTPLRPRHPATASKSPTASV